MSIKQYISSCLQNLTNSARTNNSSFDNDKNNTPRQEKSRTATTTKNTLRRDKTRPPLNTSTHHKTSILLSNPTCNN